MAVAGLEVLSIRIRQLSVVVVFCMQHGLVEPRTYLFYPGPGWAPQIHSSTVSLAFRGVTLYACPG